MVSSSISSMRRSVSSPDETPRRELKIRSAAEYFWRSSRCFIWWWNTVSNAWYYFSNKMILEGEIKDAKMHEQFFIWFSNTHETLIRFDRTPARELKIRCTMMYFWRTPRYLILWRNTAWNVYYYFSKKT